MHFLRFADLKAQNIVGNRVTLARWMQTREFPRPYRLGQRIVAWKADEVVAWCDKQRPPKAA